MSSELISHTENVLKIISERFDIDYEDMFNLISLELKFDTLVPTTKHSHTENETTCFAYVNNKKGICRCARGKTFGDFCKTHYNHYMAGTLTNGFYSPKTGPSIETIKITINKKEYLYEPIKRKIYSLPTTNKQSRFIGYLSANEKYIET
jgi:hypothetical protein